ncbi:MAG TPA: hypothetical protein VL832_29575 [Puia sp.]|jgi:hypothetical protein|nr:hypothetical protein [Puia sp.]
MEWKPGLILRIRNYKFEDDGTSRDKYAIVLHTNEDEVYLIHSLTTSRNNLAVPGTHYGCSVHQGIPYYFIPAGQMIGDEKFCFEKDTFIFFQSNIRKESYAKFEEASKTLWGVVCLGALTHEELSRIIKCALKSKFIPVSIESELSAYKATL